MLCGLTIWGNATKLLQQNARNRGPCVVKPCTWYTLCVYCYKRPVLRLRVAHYKDHLGIQLFVSNLKPILWDNLMKAPPATLNSAIKMARSLEKSHVKSDSLHTSVSEIQPQHQQQHSDMALDAKIEALSAQFQALIKRRNGNNGQQGGRGNVNNQRSRGQGRGGPGGSTTGYNVWRYCKKPGHLQKLCNSHIKAGAPEVNTQGKPYTHANEVDNDDTADGAGGTAGQLNNPWQQL